MSRMYPNSSLFTRQVILIITLAMLWVQNIGLNHSIQHHLTTTVLSGNINKLDFSTASNDGTVGLSSKKQSLFSNSSNPSSSHHCQAWESSTVSTAIFTNQLTELDIHFLFFLRASFELAIISQKFFPSFLSRAPPGR